MQEVNLEIYRGDDTTFCLRLTQGKQPFDAIGASFALQIKPTNGEGVRLSSEDGQIALFNASTLLLHFSHQLTQDWMFREARYDLQMTKEGKVKTLLRGKILLTHDITK
ncbi:hypothetical protein ACLSY8_09160 [Avibacterium avium]|uniref:hypothetical protein n=1 Tax=Avibacterium avium TaxID=751 RepID=UPI003BF8CCD3